MAFLAAINARRKPESAGASSPGDPMPFDSTDNTTTSRQRISSRPSIDSTTRPSMAPRPSLGKRGSISFSLEDVCAPLTEGREGTKMGAMSKKLKDIKELTDEKVELLYESFQMFPLDPDGRLTAEGLGTYYSRAGLVFTPDQCETMIKLFSGGTRDSLDFDEYAVAFIRCEKTLPQGPVMSIPVKGEMNIADPANSRSRDMFFDALGIKDLGDEHLQHLINALKSL